MAASPRNWRDTVWFTWFCIQIPVILCVDAVDKYPAWLCANPGAPLHFLHRFRMWYIATHNDPIVQWTAATHPLLGSGGGSWVELFFWVELVFTLPAVLYATYRLGRARASSGSGSGSGSGTTGALELLLLVYALETALTTAVCIHNVGYWDSAVYSAAQKNVFRFQLLGPWLAMPSLLFVDMYSRLLGRFRLDVGPAKKTQ